MMPTASCTVCTKNSVKCKYDSTHIYINDLINPYKYKTIVYTSTLALMLDNEGQDLLNFTLSQHS